MQERRAGRLGFGRPVPARMGAANRCIAGIQTGRPAHHHLRRRHRRRGLLRRNEARGRTAARPVRAPRWAHRCGGAVALREAGHHLENGLQPLRPAAQHRGLVRIAASRLCRTKRTARVRTGRVQLRQPCTGDPAMNRFAYSITAACLTFALALPVVSQAATAAPQPAPTMDQILKASKPSDWRALNPDDTLYMDLPQGRVVIELAPAYAPLHADNIRALAHEHYWDGLAILRVQDGFVSQWGDPAAEAKHPAHPPRSLGKAK